MTNRHKSYLRLAKRAAIMVGRYTHAHQFKRARRELKFLRTRLGRVIRDIRRNIEGDPALEDRFGPLLDLALRVRHQEQRQRGPKDYSLHAPRWIASAKATPGRPTSMQGLDLSPRSPRPRAGSSCCIPRLCTATRMTDTLGPVIADLEKLTGVAVRRIHGNKGYRGRESLRRALGVLARCIVVHHQPRQPSTAARFHVL
jgi:transposase, IS5 family